MADHGPQKVVALPLLQGSSIHDTLTGFAHQMDHNTHLGRRVAREATVLAAQIRGWDRVSEVAGAKQADTLLRGTVGRVLHAIEALDGHQISIGGEPHEPTITASFDDDSHALRAVVTAESVREAASRVLHPSIVERFQACVGVSSGMVVDTRVNGGGIEFQATGTLKMFAVRLQEFAGPDQVFLSEATYLSIPAHLDVVPIGPVRTCGDGETQEAYALRALVPDPGTR
jgi:class 3 adenylate cyclase